MREIAVDTETTGLDPASGHRVVEIGCVEMQGMVRTGRHFHVYLNPERDMPEEAFRVHGLSADFLSDQPLFHDVAEEFLTFIGGDPLVIHNADFDMKFLNAELKRIGRPVLESGRAVDTVKIARQKFPGSPANLDALCRRFQIDLSARTLHGALLDAELLAEVYLELMGGRQAGLGLEPTKEEADKTAVVREYRAPRPHAPSEEELARHRVFLAQIKDPLWQREEVA